MTHSLTPFVAPFDNESDREKLKHVQKQVRKKQSQIQSAKERVVNSKKEHDKYFKQLHEHGERVHDAHEAGILVDNEEVEEFAKFMENKSKEVQDLRDEPLALEFEFHE